ncbi:MAG: RNA polymerase sigma factor [Luteolibacter sp.]
MSSPASFRSTRWTLVHRVGCVSEDGARAMEELCAIYYEPVYQFVCRRLNGEERASDLTQAFFESLLKKSSLGKPDPAKGRFRSYLLGAVKHFLRDEQAKSKAARRGGGYEAVELDEEMMGEPDEHRHFDRDWALAVIFNAYESVSLAMEEAGKEKQFEVLRPWLDGGQSGDSAEAAKELGMGANAFKVAVHRLREKFRAAVRDEIRATIAEGEAVGEEFSYLIEVLSD